VCHATRPHDGWQKPPEDGQRLASSLSDSRARVLRTRGLFTLKVKIPDRPKGDTFSWTVGPPAEWPEGCVWYIDGSLSDETRSFGRRTGFAIVVVGSHGALLAAGQGIPPIWVVDAAGAELWAFATVTRLNGTCPRVVTDCKGILDGLKSGPSAVTAADNKLARTWHIIVHNLDDSFAEAATKTTWMPSHCSVASINKVLDSNGTAVTAVMWRVNRLADLFAKEAAAEHRLPAWVYKQVNITTEIVQHSAGLLGMVTLNNVL